MKEQVLLVFNTVQFRQLTKSTQEDPTMLYLGIDQHRKQLTVNLRDEAGTTLLRRQVSTQWSRVRTFLAEIQSMSSSQGGFMAMVEVCGFNDWLLRLP
jgi:transposase